MNSAYGESWHRIIGLRMGDMGNFEAPNGVGMSNSFIFWSVAQRFIETSSVYMQTPSDDAVMWGVETTTDTDFDVIDTDSGSDTTNDTSSSSDGDFAYGSFKFDE